MLLELSLAKIYTQGSRRFGIDRKSGVHNTYAPTVMTTAIMKVAQVWHLSLLGRDTATAAVTSTLSAKRTVTQHNSKGRPV